MKKISLFALIFCFLLVLPAVSFATTITSAGGQGSTDIVKKFKTSNNVHIEVTATQSAYYANSGHLNGDKQYGTISGDSVFYWATKTEGQNISAADSGTISGWSQL